MHHTLLLGLALITASVSALAADTYHYRMSVPGLKASTAGPVAPPPAAHTFAAWNAADMGPNIAVSNAGLTATVTSWHSTIRATQGVTSGKWYWEVTLGAGANWPNLGVMGAAGSISGYLGQGPLGWGWCGAREVDSIGTRPSVVNGQYGAPGSFALGKTLGLALDMGIGTLTYSVNGVSQGVAFTGITGEVFPAASACDYQSVDLQTNFGSAPFKYPVPAGFNAGVYRD